MLNLSKISLFVLLLGIFLPDNIQAQNLKQILNQIKERNDELTNYRVNISYKLYEQPYTKVKESKNGTFFRDGNKYYIKLGEAEMLYTPTINLKINHNEKAILIANSNISNLPLNFSLDNFPNTEKTLTSNAKYRIITIKAGKISQFPYSKVVFYFDKKQLLLHKVSFYLLSRVGKDQKTKQPKLLNYRLDLTLTDYRFGYNHQNSKDKFLPSKYLSFKDHKVKGVGPLSSYQIIDYRKTKVN